MAMDTLREAPSATSTTGRWALAWAFTTAAVLGSGGGDWTQAPLWMATSGFALACAGLLYGGFGMARGAVIPRWRRMAAAAAWPAGFAVACGLLFTGALGIDLRSLLLGAGLAGCLGGVASAFFLDRPGHPAHTVGRLGAGLVWGFAFALGALATIYAGYMLGELLKGALQPMLGWWPGFVLGQALAGALGGALAGGIGAVLTADPVPGTSTAGRDRAPAR